MKISKNLKKNKKVKKCNMLIMYLLADSPLKCYNILKTVPSGL